MWGNNMKPKPTALFLIVPIVIACANTVQETPRPEPRVRAALKAAGSGTVKAAVTVEGPDGNALSGAIVNIRDNRNIITPLNYETAACAYTGTMEEYEGSTAYSIEVSSVTLSTPLKITVPYTAITETPNVTVFQDACGNSVLNGQSLLASQPIQIGWTSCGGDTTCQITIKTAIKRFYSVSTTASVITIPANTLPPGSYFLETTVQKIHGDIYFNTAPYYSMSAAASPLVACNVK
jgi:hypothetical protein